jgi:hypothetical protein
MMEDRKLPFSDGLGTADAYHHQQESHLPIPLGASGVADSNKFIKRINDEDDDNDKTPEVTDVDDHQLLTYKNQVFAGQPTTSNKNIDSNVQERPLHHDEDIHRDHKSDRIRPVVEDRVGMNAAARIPRVEHIRPSHNNNSNNHNDSEEEDRSHTTTDRYHHPSNRQQYDSNWGVNSIPIAAEVVMDPSSTDKKPEEVIPVTNSSTSTVPIVPVMPYAPLAHAIPLSQPTSTLSPHPSSQPSKSNATLSTTIPSASSNNWKRYIVIGIILLAVIGAAFAILLVTGIVQITGLNNSATNNVTINPIASEPVAIPVSKPVTKPIVMPLSQPIKNPPLSVPSTRRPTTTSTQRPTTTLTRRPTTTPGLPVVTSIPTSALTTTLPSSNTMEPSREASLLWQTMDPTPDWIETSLPTPQVIGGDEPSPPTANPTGPNNSEPSPVDDGSEGIVTSNPVL